MATRTEWLGRLEVALLVAVGGFAGGSLRHVLGVLLPGLVGTLAANVLGCLALGFLVYEAELVGVFGERTSLVVGSGFLSSFTTYSTFALETVRSAPLVGVANVVASYALGFAAVLAGRALARRLAAADRTTEGPR